jgi:hypothetical protein
MTTTVLPDENQCYIKLMNKHEMKFQSFEDNVYFTLRDIFLNATEFTDIGSANSFNHLLTNGIYFGDRDLSFQYTNVLSNKKFVEKLIKWLKTLHESSFDFIQFKKEFDNNKYGLICHIEEFNPDEFLESNIWFDHFNDFKTKLNQLFLTL